MRTIKFRGKDIETGEWVYGVLLPKPQFDKYFIWDYDYNQKEVIPDTVGQYVCVNDKNGKEIYEGDVVALPGITGVVVYDFAAFVAEILPLRYKIEWLDSDMEIIGNIHDNPELLKEG